jgi:hypothetical protein
MRLVLPLSFSTTPALNAMTHEITSDGLYRLSINSAGKVDAANLVSNGNTVWCPNSDRYTAGNPDTADFMAHNYDLRDRPVAPSPSPSPNYEQFRIQITAAPAYIRISSANLQAASLNGLLVSLFWQLDANPAIASEIVTTWNRMIAGVLILPGEVTALNAIATANNVRLRLAANGQMSII